MDRALASGARGCAFESRRGYCRKEQLVSCWKPLVCLLVGWVLLVGHGCAGLSGPDPYRRLGPARDIVSASVEWLGGYDTWGRLGPVRASAVVSIHDSNGQAYVSRQQQTIDIHGGRLVAAAHTAQGPWTATVHDSGRYDLGGSGVVFDRQMQERICGELATLLHRVRGPLNLLRGSEKVNSVERTRLGGEDVIRVAVDGSGGQAIAYYFEATSGVLRYVTAGSERPGAEGTVTVYTYMMLPNGMAFPRRIRVVETGENVVIGLRPVFEAEFTDVEVD